MNRSEEKLVPSGYRVPAELMKCLGQLGIIRPVPAGFSRNTTDPPDFRTGHFEKRQCASFQDVFF